MANADRPVGLSPVSHLNGSTYNGQVNKYVILSTDNGQYGIGSAVKSFAGGDTDGVSAITIAAAGNALRGVIVAIIPQDQSSPPGPIPASKSRNYYVLVADAPDIVYEIQSNNSSAFLTSDLNSNANIVVGVPGSFGPFCTTQLDASTTDTTSTLQLKILGKVQRTDVDLTANTKLLVMINAHELSGFTTAVA